MVTPRGLRSRPHAVWQALAEAEAQARRAEARAEKQMSANSVEAKAMKLEFSRIKWLAKHGSVKGAAASPGL